MKKRNLAVLFAVMALTASAQSKLDIQSRARLLDTREQIEVLAKQKGMTAKKAAAEQKIEVFVKMNTGIDATELSAKGFDVKANRAEFAVVSLPLSRIDELNDMTDVSSISYGRKLQFKLTTAHSTTGVDKIKNGELTNNDNLPFSGKGVIIGDIDTGFEPNHPMFLDKDGATRVKYYANSSSVLTDPARIANITTDTRASFHGTHVMGIAGGNYESDAFSISGVAPGADLAMHAISGYDSEIVAAIEKLVAYAKSKNEPLVINMSLGDNNGPHDNTDQMSQYINKVIADKDAVICIAAGNEGQDPIVQKKTFKSEDDQMTAYLYNASYYKYGQQYDYACSLWSENKEPFNIALVLYNTQTKEIVKQYDALTKDTIASYRATTDADFAKYFKGTLRISTAPQTNGTKYGATITTNNLQQLNSYVIPGYIVTGKTGQQVVCYSSDWVYLVSSVTKAMSYYGEDQYVEADGVTRDGTINNMVAGTDAIAVGSYNTGDKIKLSDNKTYTLYVYGEDNSVNEVSSFSSWGTVNGIDMPYITAPGALIESATNTYYVNATREPYTHKAYVNGRTSYWTISMGTSMATPYFSGVAALWLEADPTLTNEKIKEVAIKTANKDSYVKNTKNPVQFGAGKIDAYKGLKYILDQNVTALKNIDADKDWMFRATGDNTYEAFVAGENAITVRIFDMNGRLVATEAASGNTVNFSVAAMPKGIYAVELCGSNTSHKLKIAVK